MAVRTLTKYESNTGTIHGISLSAVTAAVTGNPPPAGAVDSPINAKISKSEREYGIRPRGVRIFLLVGTSPNQFKRYAFIPILTPTTAGQAAFQKGQTISYKGDNWTIATVVPEDY